MAAEAITIERRQYPRNGVLGHLEDITYAALRRYQMMEKAAKLQAEEVTVTEVQ